MASEATRSGRPTVPALLVLLLALIAGLSTPPVVTGTAVPGPTVVSTAVSRPAEAAVPAMAEPPAAPVAATGPVAGDRARVLRPQPVDAVRAPRAPPVVTV
jgi:hypothetical protein